MSVLKEEQTSEEKPEEEQKPAHPGFKGSGGENISSEELGKRLKALSAEASSKECAVTASENSSEITNLDDEESDRLVENFSKQAQEILRKAQIESVGSIRLKLDNLFKLFIESVRISISG